MGIEECKRSCREGRLVAGCKSIVFYKKTQGCWLLPEDKQTYENRGDYYDFFDSDFYELECEDDGDNGSQGKDHRLTEENATNSSTATFMN